MPSKQNLTIFDTTFIEVYLLVAKPVQACTSHKDNRLHWPRLFPRDISAFAFEKGGKAGKHNHEQRAATRNTSIYNRKSLNPTQTMLSWQA